MTPKPPLVASRLEEFLLGQPLPGVRRPCSRCGCTLVLAPSSLRMVEADQVHLLCLPCAQVLYPGPWRPALLPGAAAELAALAAADPGRN